MSEPSTSVCLRDVSLGGVCLARTRKATGTSSTGKQPPVVYTRVREYSANKRERKGDLCSTSGPACIRRTMITKTSLMHQTTGGFVSRDIRSRKGNCRFSTQINVRIYARNKEELYLRNIKLVIIKERNGLKFTAITLQQSTYSLNIQSSYSTKSYVETVLWSFVAFVSRAIHNYC